MIEISLFIYCLKGAEHYGLKKIRAYGVVVTVIKIEKSKLRNCAEEIVKLVKPKPPHLVTNNLKRGCLLDDFDLKENMGTAAVVNGTFAKWVNNKTGYATLVQITLVIAAQLDPREKQEERIKLAYKMAIQRAQNDWIDLKKSKGMIIKETESYQVDDAFIPDKAAEAQSLCIEIETFIHDYLGVNLMQLAKADTSEYSDARPLLNIPSSVEDLGHSY